MTTLSQPLESNAVRDLFNRKAVSWHQKYAASGPLAHRLQLFARGLVEAMPPSAHVLEIGCGTGNLAMHLTTHGYCVTACDIAEEMLAEAQRAFPQADIDWLLSSRGAPLPVTSGSCDAVVASSVFEYIDGIADVLAECRRVLKPGGVLVFSVPNLEHWHRRLEAALLPACAALRVSELPRPARLQSYLEYLFLSKNRLTVAEWQALAAEAGFECLGEPDTSAGSLLLLRFRRLASPTADIADPAR